MLRTSFWAVFDPERGIWPFCRRILSSKSASNHSIEVCFDSDAEDTSRVATFSLSLPIATSLAPVRFSDLRGFRNPLLERESLAPQS